jgi:hypothetical protein
VTSFAIGYFHGTKPVGRAGVLDLDGLRAMLLDRCYRRRDKDDYKFNTPAWSPTRYASEYSYTRHFKDGTQQHVEVHAPAAHRRDEGVVGLSCVVLDVDGATVDWPTLIERGHLTLAYTTFSHSEARPCWRVIFPLAREVPAQDWRVFWHSAVVYFNLLGVDPACKDISHQYWLHATRTDADPLLPATRELGSTLLDPAAIPLVEPPVDLDIPLLPEPKRPPTDRDLFRAARLLRTAVERLAAHDPGGRQVSSYGYARQLGPWVRAGCLRAQQVKDSLWHACQRNGVVYESAERAAEIDRAINNGLARGYADGVVDLDAAWPQSTRERKSA